VARQGEQRWNRTLRNCSRLFDVSTSYWEQEEAFGADECDECPNVVISSLGGRLNIYVGNLDFSTHQDQLQTLFAAYGAVKTVTTVTDRDTGQPRGFAFVEMTSAAQA
jgi:RNA recognition motif-containing protein